MTKNIKKNNGLRISFKRGLFDINLSFSIGPEKALTFLLILLVLLLILTSSLDLDVRQLLLDTLLGLVQWLMTRQHNEGKQR